MTNPFEQGPAAPQGTPNPFGGPPAAPPAPPGQYPPQQPYPPAAPPASPYAPQPASAPPAPAYPPQPQYAPQGPPQQAAAPFPYTIEVGGPTGADPFRPPAPQVDRPRVQDLFGCLLLVMPKRIERGIVSRFKNPDGSPQHQDRMTADIIVLRGPSQSQHGSTPTHVAYGGAPEGRANQYRPHDKWFAVPGKIAEMYVSNKGLISQCRDALEQTLGGKGQGMVLGVLDQGAAQGDNNPPWLLREFDANDAALARQWLAVNPVI